MKSSAEEPKIGEKMYHIGLGFGVLSGFVLLPGDPGRVDLVLSFLEGSRVLCFKREFKSGVGFYKGVRVGVLSTGIGGPSTAIAVEELARIGAHTLIRIGTTGTIQKNIKIGDLIISTAAVRLEGTSKQYVIPEYPAVASYDVVVALIAAAESLGVRYHVGITASTDSFYVGQQRPGYKNYLPSFARNIIEDLRMANVLNFEMEAATLFTLASIFGLRAGAVSLVLANRVTNEFELVPQDDLIKVGLEAVKILNEMDESKEGRYWYPKELVKKGID